MRSFIGVSTLAVVLAAGAGRAPAAPQAAPATRSSFELLSGSLASVAERVGPSVVQVFTTGYGIGSGAVTMTKQQGTASGIILSPDGYIITNAHVVNHAERIRVLLADRVVGRETKRVMLKPRAAKIEAKLVGIDTATDLALLKIDSAGLPGLALSDSNAVRQGQLVLAFGSPLGLGNTVTMGVVSAVARQLREDDAVVYIQTDAPINPGNSGGPLVNAAGEVIGINAMILSQSGGSEGVGLAIPSNTVRDIVGQLRANGRVRRGVIGIQAQSVTSVMAAALSLPQTWGVIVTDMAEDGPAATAGLRIGDVIVSIDGKDVENVRQFGINLYRHAIEATVAIEILRGADRLALTVPVSERPDDPARLIEFSDPQKNLVPQLDLLGVDLTDELAAAFGPARLKEGVLVVAMSAEAAPPGDRFQPGDIIHSVNHTSVGSLAELRAAVANFKDGDPVVIQIERQGRLTLVSFEID